MPQLPTLNTSLKGFTLLEMMVGLALMGLVVITGGLVLQILGKLHLGFVEKQAEAQEVLLLQQQIRKDLRKTYHWEEAAPETGAGAVVRCFDRKGELLSSYRLADGKVLRQSLTQIDTFAWTGSWAWEPGRWRLQDSLRGWDISFLPWTKSSVD